MSKRNRCLDQISLDLMIASTKAAGVRRTQTNAQACAGFQIAIREALRAMLPANDPRRDQNYPFNETPQRSGGHATHPYEPHEKHPQFCAVCGYAASERLMHLASQPADQTRQGEPDHG